MKYKLTFKTGLQSGAGTDADVFISLYGSKGKVENIKLNLSGKNIFEKGSKDIFTIDIIELGDIRKIELSHNNKWFGADWFLDDILIKNVTSNKTWYFPAYKWIRKDNIISLKTVTPANYIFEITTGTLPGAGTNSNIFISLIGSDSYTDFFDINSLIKKNEFTTAHTESFEIIKEDVGEIKEIKIKCDTNGFKDNWFLARLRIKKNKKNNFITFPFFNWIKPNKIYTLSKELVEYTIKIYTGDVAHGGTDANVSMVLIGTKRSSRTIQLNELIARNAFEAGKTDYFKITEKNLGEIKKINIWHNEKWLADGWFLNKIIIKNDKTGKETVFPYYSWLDKSENPKSTNIFINAKPVKPRPFYVIAHMVNTPAYAEEALDMGTNAIEFDITPTLQKDGNFTFDVYHGFRPDFDPDKVNLMERSIARTDLKTYIKNLNRLENEYEKFSLVIYDCKLEKVPKSKLELCGKQMAEIIDKYFYSDKKDERVKSIISIPKKKFVAFIDGFSKTIPQKYFKDIGFDLSMENFKTTENTFRKRPEQNFWWGSGIAAMVPKTLKHFVPQFLIAAKKRTTQGIIKKIYYWTLESPESMERMLVTKLDGIIVNDPLKLLKVLEKEEFRNSYRLATRDDNPFEVI